jgi:uncharacterized protein
VDAIPAAWVTIGVVALGAALAGFVEGASAVEFPLLALSLWAWMLPPELAASLALFGALLGAVAGLFSPRGFDLRRVAPFAIGGVLGAPLGIFLLHNAGPSRFRLAVGALLALYAIFVLAFRDSARARPGGAGADALVGVIGGAFGGFCGLASAPPAIWTRLGGWKRDPRHATIRAFVVVVAVVTLVADARIGAIEPGDLRLFGIAAPVALVASFLGAKMIGKARAPALGRVALLLALASAAALVVVAARSMWGR